MKRPMMFICVVYILGILLVIYHSIYLIYGLILGYIIGIFILKNTIYIKYYLMVPAICLFAFINIFIQFGLVDIAMKDIQVEEEITAICYVNTVEEGGSYLKATCTLTKLNQNGTVVNKGMKVLVYFDVDDPVGVGDEVLLTGNIYEIKGASNPGGFDSNLYYYSKKIFFSLFPEEYKIIKNKPITSLKAAIRDNMKQGIDRVFPEKEASVISTMILGLKSDLDQDTRDYYDTAGLSHLLAISGLHVSIIGLGIFSILKRIMKREKYAAGLSILLVGFYCLLTGCSVSTTRATIMLSVMFLSYMVYRKYDVYAALYTTAVLLLIYNPYQIFDIGFLLSFTAVLGIIYINPKLSQRFNRDNRTVISLMLTTLSASLSTYPIVLWYFYKIPTYAVLINLVVLPVISLVILIGVLASITSCFFMPLARLLAGSVFCLLNYIEACCVTVGYLPFHSIYLGQPMLIHILLYYLILVLILLREKLRVGRWVKVAIITMCLTGIIVPSLYQYFALEIVFLDVGQGDSCCIRYKGKTFLIDGGGEIFVEGDNTGINVLLPYLESEGIRKIDGIFLSHSDFDHICGIIEIIELIDTDYIVMSCPYETYDDELSLRLYEIAEDKGIQIYYFDDQDRFEYHDLVLDCVFPSREINSYENANDMSMVLRLSFYELSILFTGDIEETPERYMVANHVDIASDIIKVPHHGSNSSSTEAFVEAVDAQVAILSYGEHNVFNHPAKSVVRRYEEADTMTYHTAVDGAITVRVIYPYKSYTMTTYSTDREESYPCNNSKN